VTELAGKAIIAAGEDADRRDRHRRLALPEASAYGDKMDTATFMETLGIPEVTVSAALTSGGGGSAGAIGLARAALVAGDATYVVTLMALQQRKQRLGTVFGAAKLDPQNSFLMPSGLVGPGHLMSVLTRRHMHPVRHPPQAFAEIAISTRERGTAGTRERTLTIEDYSTPG
jgi:hypothetical protein